MDRPRLRDNTGHKPFELYPLGQVPFEAIYRIGKYITYLCLVGNKDLSGHDWGDAFAYGIKGMHLNSPVGLADVVYKTQCWSTKTVIAKSPLSANNVRIISGRCSPDFSYNINDPHSDIQKTGNAVLGIYNERINIAKSTYEPLRAVVLLRNFDTLEFTVFEHDIVRYDPADFKWKYNKKGNLEAYDSTGKRHFTWQFHGAQFTIHCNVPASAIRFKLRHPPILDIEKTLEQVEYNDNWVTII